MPRLRAEAAKEVVLAEKPVIGSASEGMEASLLDHLLREIGALSSVLHRPLHSLPAAAAVPQMALPSEAQGQPTDLLPTASPPAPARGEHGATPN